MKNENVYLVMGETGDYSAHVTWPVRTFAKRRAAKRFCKVCQKEANRCNWRRWMLVDRFKHSLDPDFKCEAGGTLYSVVKIPFEP